jgi:hypothetical protein
MFLSLPDFLHKVDALGKGYRGIVVNNVDPEEIGRLQINIPSLIVGTQGTDGSWNLPWTYQKSSSMLGGRSDSSSFAVPEIGSEVFVEFPYDDIYSGFYSYYWQSSTTHQSFLNEDYPASYGFRDILGTQLKIDKAKKFLEFIHASGAQFFIDSNSDITLQSSTSISFVSSDGKTSFVFDLATGDVNFGAKDAFTMATPTLNTNVDTHNETIGNKNENISGGKTSNISGGLTTAVAGDIAEAALSNKATTIAGNKTELVAGTVDETFGQTQTKTIVLGNYEIDLLDGDYEVDVTAGDISLSTLAGSTSIGNSLGSYEVGTDGTITAENDVASVVISPNGEIKIKNTAGGELNISPTGMVALGNSSAELLSLVDQILTQLISLTQYLSTEAPSGFGAPLVFAAQYLAENTQLTTIKTQLDLIKGSL